MSASTEKKQRQAARAAGTDKKMLAEQEAAKKKAVSRRRWTIGTILVILLIAAILLLDSGVLYKNTTAVTAGDSKFSPAEMNYYYSSEYMNLLNTYGSYASMLGLDTSSGISGLKDQACSMLEDGTWRDYFLERAEQTASQIAALTAYAKANDISLDEEEIAAVDAGFEGADDYARAQGYAHANNLFAANYGAGVTQKLVRETSLARSLASKVYTQVSDSFTYTDEELESYYQGLDGDRDLFDFLVYDVKAEVAEGAEAPEETALIEAKATADAIQMAYQDGYDIEDVAERFEAALEAEDLGAPNRRTGAAGSSLSSDYSAWLKGDRSEGDVTVVPDSDGTGTSVVVFLSRNDNHYHTASVRHILVKAAASEDGSYSDEAKTAAKELAEKILGEWEAGEKTEESFAALAQQYSEDEGSKANGGLYENIYRGQMVSEFDAFCFEPHESGDTGIVYGESGSYAGYHVMYYVGQGDLYSNVISESALRSEAIDSWMEEQMTGFEPVEKFWIKLVG